MDLLGKGCYMKLSKHEKFAASVFVVDVPLDRIGVLIGSEGRVKAEIEDKLGVELVIDSSTGSVAISPPESDMKKSDPASLLRARDLVTAIARGFSPERAFRLLDENIVLNIIDITDFAGKNPENLKRIKSRLIGTKGKTRKIIEETCNVYVSIYNDTVSIIGHPEDVQAANEAITSLINGLPHSAVYRFLDDYARRRKVGRVGGAVY